MAGDENCQNVIKCCIATSHTVTFLEEPQSSQFDITMIIQVAKNQKLTGKLMDSESWLKVKTVCFLW